MAEVYSVVDSLNLDENADFWTDPSGWNAATIDAQLGIFFSNHPKINF